jgi:hypothetical protein
MEEWSLKRRKFTALVGGVLAGWPLMARGQQQRLRVIGILVAGIPNPAEFLKEYVMTQVQHANFSPELVTIMKSALDAAVHRIERTHRTPATKAKMGSGS